MLDFLACRSFITYGARKFPKRKAGIAAFLNRNEWRCAATIELAERSESSLVALRLCLYVPEHHACFRRNNRMMSTANLYPCRYRAACPWSETGYSRRNPPWQRTKQLARIPASLAHPQASLQNRISPRSMEYAHDYPLLEKKNAISQCSISTNLVQSKSVGVASKHSFSLSICSSSKEPSRL